MGDWVCEQVGSKLASITVSLHGSCEMEERGMEAMNRRD